IPLSAPAQAASATWQAEDVLAGVTRMALFENADGEARAWQWARAASTPASGVVTFRVEDATVATHTVATGDVSGDGIQATLLSPANNSSFRSGDAVPIEYRVR